MASTAPVSGITCPQCGYVRKPTDTMTGPEECPACGILYAKAVARPNRPVEDIPRIAPGPGLRKQDKSGPLFRLRFAICLVLCIVCLLIAYKVDKNFKENVKLEAIRITAAGFPDVAKAYLKKMEKNQHPISVFFFHASCLLGVAAYLSRKEVTLGDFIIRARSADSSVKRLSFLAKCILYGICLLMALSIMIRTLIFVFGFTQMMMEKETPAVSQTMSDTRDKPEAPPKDSANIISQGMPVITYLNMVHAGVIQYITDNSGQPLRKGDLDTVLNDYLLWDELIILRKKDALRMKVYTPMEFDIAIFNGKKWFVMDQDKRRWTASSF